MGMNFCVAIYIHIHKFVVYYSRFFITEILRYEKNDDNHYRFRLFANGWDTRTEIKQHNLY